MRIRRLLLLGVAGTISAVLGYLIVGKMLEGLVRAWAWFLFWGS